MNRRGSKFLKQLSGGRRSTEETLMSSNFLLFSVAVKLKIGVDSLERLPQN